MRLKLLFIIGILLSQVSVAQEFDFNCYSANVKLNNSNINEIRLGWSKVNDWISFIVYKTSDNKYYVEDASCPQFGRKGDCSIADDGGFVSLTPNNPGTSDFKKYGPIKFEILGTPTLQETDIPGEFRAKIVPNIPTFAVGMRRVHKNQCKYKYP